MLDSFLQTTRTRLPGQAIGTASVLSFLLGVAALCGCRHEDTSTTTAVTPSSGSTNNSTTGDTVQLAADTPTGVDDQDAAERARAIPRSGMVGGWVKSKPIQLSTAAEYGATLTQEPFKSAFSIIPTRRVVRCEYQLDAAKAEVLYVEADPFDALGLFTVFSAQPRPILLADGSARGEGVGHADVITGWQGDVFLQVSLSGTITDATKARAQQLADRIIFSLPSADAPLLMRIIPKERRARCRVWFVRNAKVLRLLNVPGLKDLPADEVDQLFGSGDKMTLSVAAIEIVPGEPHLIWLTEYATPDAAKAAYDRWTKAIEAATSSLTRSSTVQAARGNFLPGTWTKQQENLQPVLPLLLAALPEPATQPARTSTAPATK